MGKTESIKERRVDVYLDTIGRKERWTRKADEADESLSKFVQQCVEYALEKGGPNFEELGERGKKIQDLEEEMKSLRNEVKQKNIVIEKLEADLGRYRMEPFLKDDYEGVRDFDQELIQLVKEAERIKSEELVRRLGVDQTDRETMQAIDSQLRQLESYGLIAHTTHGWRWDG
jgi:predicted RNase H-like nuclease (RuvC/YqgF family)